MHKPVYLDYHATTPVDPRVLRAMLPFFEEKFGNAASRGHSFGWEAEKAVELARRQVAELMSASPREIVFTSGATEAVNLALKGVVESLRGKACHLITMTTEHKAVLDTVQHLVKGGCRVTWLAPQPDGRLDPAALRAAIEPETALVSVMYANNEIGVIQPVREIGAICRERGVLFHCDAVQAFGKIPVSVEDDHVDLMSVSAHKICGPKGIGALYVRRRHPRVHLVAQMDGGGHESGMRSGTLNVPAIAGFGAACAICSLEMADEEVRLRQLRDRLRMQLESGLEHVRVNGSMQYRLAGNLNMTFESVDANSLLMSLPEVALSTGSACTSATVTPSHVLQALGLSREEAHSSVRFGLGRFTTEEEVDYAAGRVVESVKRLRMLTPA